MSNPFTGGLNNFNYEVARNRIPGFETWNKFGYNLDVDGAAEVVASWGGTFDILETADTLDVVSTSSEDASGGTGAKSVIIYGVDANGNHIIEVVTMNGLTPVTTTNSYFGVNRVAIYLNGTAASNVGIINITATTGGEQQAQMPAGQGTTQQCIFHVGSGKTFLADQLILNINKISGGGNPVVTVKGFVYARLTTATYEVFRITIDTQVENTVPYPTLNPFVIAENQVLYFTAETNTANTVVNLRFSGILCNS